MNLKLGVSALSACLLMGCATVTRGKHETFVVESTPANARVELSTGEKCDATPCSFRVKRKGALDVTVSKDGYKTTKYNVPTQVAGGGAAGVAGNVLVGGIIGLGVDAATGAALEHKPNPLQATLDAEPVVVAETTAAPSAPAIPGASLSGAAPATLTPIAATAPEGATTAAPAATTPASVSTPTPAPAPSTTPTPASMTPTPAPAAAATAPAGAAQ